MITKVHATLFEAIRQDEQKFDAVIAAAVASSLADLGGNFHLLDWSVSAAQKDDKESKAA